MSAPQAGVTDPLEALRAADHRPRAQALRERIAASVSGATISPSGPLRTFGVGLLVALALAAVGWRLFVTSQPPVDDSLPFAAALATSIPPASAEPVSTVSEEVPSAAEIDDQVAPAGVHVAGAVVRPGLISGVGSMRVADAIDAAGGSTWNADLDRLNLAAPIADGQRIFVPSVGEPAPVLVEPTSSLPDGSVAAGGGPVDINNADSQRLQTLDGVGPATAQAIIEHRDAHGNFATVDALIAVGGIGPATLERLRSQISVG